MRIATPAILAAAAAIAAFVLSPAATARTEITVGPRIDSLDSLANRIATRGFWNGENGAWKTKTQFVIDPATKQLTRKVFTVWDPAPSRGLDFVWKPDDPVASDGDIVSGEGTLVWRLHDRPAYDASAVVSEYRGTMKNGRPDGFGEYRNADGIAYAGNWENGVSAGYGDLQYPNGDEFQGTFKGGIPDGEGRYFASTGESFEGRFSGGRRGARLAQMGEGAAAPSDVALGVRLNPIQKSYGITDEVTRKRRSLEKDEIQELNSYAVAFSAASQSNLLAVQPRGRRLMGMWKGDANIALTDDEEKSLYHTGFGDSSIYGVFSLSPTLLPPLGVVLDVQNRSAAPIQIVGFYLDVASSATDMQPAIQITSLPGELRDECGPDSHGAYMPFATLENFGWGQARNAELRIGSDKAPPGGQDFQIRLGTVDKHASADFEPYLRLHGVQSKEKIHDAIAAVWSKYHGDNAADDQAAPDRAVVDGLKATKVFGSLSARVALRSDVFQIGVQGVLAYDWSDQRGQIHHRQSPFKTNLTLGQLPAFGECGEGSPIERIRQNSVVLRNDGQSYRIAVPARRGIPAGRVGSYAFEIDSARSSEHNFAIVAQLADGREIRSRPVDLLFFRPSWIHKENAGN